MERKDGLPLLIGVSGRSGSGKDRFFSTILAPLGYTRLSLADGVRVLSAILLSEHFRNIDGRLDLEKLLRSFPSIYSMLFVMEKSPFSRILQQHVGTDLGRAYDEDYWIKTVSPLVEERLRLGIRVAITDVRFPNEAEWVKSLGGMVVMVVGNGRYKEGQMEAKHPSEYEVDNVPYDITDEDFVRLFLM